MSNEKLYPVYNANGALLGEVTTATKAGELLAVDAMGWDDSGRGIQVTLSNVNKSFAWTDSRLSTQSLLPLLQLQKK